jgi:predicted PurR-regulated permease PerM
MSHYAKATVVIVVTLAVLAAAWDVRNILLLVLVAAVLAIGLDPAVRRLERVRIRRGWAVFLIFFATVAFIAAFIALVIPPLLRQVTKLASDIPGYIDRLRHSNGFFGDLERKYQIAEKLQDLTKKLPTVAGSSIKTILGLTKSVGAIIFNLLTITILTIYFLMSLPRAKEQAIALFPPRERARGGHLLGESLDRVGGYVSGNITISVIAGVTAYVALRIMGIPFAIALAMWVAIADLIPSVGATLGAVAAVIVAAFSSIADMVGTIVYFILYQQFENYFIAPRVMRHAVDLSPAAVIVSVLIGGSLAGFAGALLALPIGAVIKVVINELYVKERVAA